MTDMISTRRVSSSGGVDLALHHIGGTGSPLLICHATGFHGRAYLTLARELAPAFEVWAMDFRGHGASTGPADCDFAWTGMAEDVIHVLRHIGVGSVIGVGHSMGGASILRAELMRPGSFAGAYLFEPIVPPGHVDGPVDTTLVDVARARRAVFPTRQAVVERYGARPPLGELDPQALVDYVEYGFVDTDDGQVRLACDPEHEARTFETPDKMSVDELAGLQLPTVVAMGLPERSGMPAIFAPPVAEAVDGASLSSHPELGHFGPLEDPAGIAAEIIERFS